jgi:hypothetical protein
VPRDQDPVRSGCHGDPLQSANGVVEPFVQHLAAVDLDLNGLGYGGHRSVLSWVVLGGPND